VACAPWIKVSLWHHEIHGQQHGQAQAGALAVHQIVRLTALPTASEGSKLQPVKEEGRPLLTISK
jgi:hypothetical protein